MKVVHVTTISMTLPFLAGHVRFLRDRGHDVHVVCHPDAFLEAFGHSSHAVCHGIPMSRRISPVADLDTLWRLFVLFRRLRPDAVHGHTPKGGMLAMIAAFAARVPARIYTIHGLPFVAATGMKRRLLRASESVSCSLAQSVFCVSHSMLEIARSERLTVPSKLHVLANGSVGGVDTESRFNPAMHAAGGSQWRAEHGIPAGAFVFTFVGRLTPEKGLAELAEAWSTVREATAATYLVVVGPVDTTDARLLRILEQFQADARVRLINLDWNTPPIFAASDVLCLPTYREGFPVTVLEAAAMGLPTIGTAVPGCTDAVKDGVTGTLVPAGDAAALADAMLVYAASRQLTTTHGASARRWAQSSFQPQRIWKETLAAYHTFVDRNSGQRSNQIYSRVGKRSMDVAFAAIILAASLPLLGFVAMLIRLGMGRPVIFRQARPGLGGEPFDIVKFRTMQLAEASASDESRMTRLGRFLRSTSLDELPELWNVLKGDMSLVGPRPLLMQYLERYTPEQARRHQVLPGITGLAQVRGRNALTWEQKFELDVWYVDHRSFALDLRILAQTVWRVVARRDISQPGHVTAREFMGSLTR
jgi:lipopolysaccharide/colanic/teichoic acid biosynthesis glycosyltransferase